MKNYYMALAIFLSVCGGCTEAPKPKQVVVEPYKPPVKAVVLPKPITLPIFPTIATKPLVVIARKEGGSIERSAYSFFEEYDFMKAALEKCQEELMEVE